MPIPGSSNSKQPAEPIMPVIKQKGTGAPKKSKKNLRGKSSSDIKQHKMQSAKENNTSGSGFRVRKVFLTNSKGDGNTSSACKLASS
jgi:hypothetical protein